MKKLAIGGRVSAGTFNNLVDDYNRRQNTGATAPSSNTPRPTDVVKVRNDTNADLPRGAVVELGSLILNELDPQNVWLSAVVPNGQRQFGIMVQPVLADSDSVWPCQVAGACVALVNVTNEDHTHAVVEAGQTVLQSAESGPVRIVWKPEGEGELSCLVLLGSESEPQVARKVVWVEHAPAIYHATSGYQKDERIVSGSFSEYKFYKVLCNVQQFDSITGGMVGSDEEIVVVNLSGLPVNRRFCHVTQWSNGLWIIDKMLGDYSQHAYCSIAPASSSQAAAIDGRKLLAGTVTTGGNSNTESPDGELTHWLTVRSSSIFLRFPGRYLITFGARAAVSSGLLTYDQMSTSPLKVDGSAEGGVTTHYHKTNLPGGAVVQVYLLHRLFDPPGSLSSTTFNQALTSIRIPLTEHANTATGEKTYELRWQPASGNPGGTDTRWMRLMLGFQPTSNVSDFTSAPSFTLSEGWISVLPLQSATTFIGINQYPSYDPDTLALGSQTWWGDGDKPHAIGVDGDDLGEVS
jgi:hypothetical protein